MEKLTLEELNFDKGLDRSKGMTNEEVKNVLKLFKGEK